MLRSISSSIHGSTVEQFQACMHVLKMGFTGGNKSIMAAVSPMRLQPHNLSNKKTLKNSNYNAASVHIVVVLLSVYSLKTKLLYGFLSRGGGGAPERPGARLYIGSGGGKFLQSGICRKPGRLPTPAAMRRPSPLGTVTQNSARSSGSPKKRGGPPKSQGGNPGMVTHTAAHFGPLTGPKASRPPSASHPTPHP